MKSNKENQLAWLMSGLFGILAGVFLTFGYQLETYDHIDIFDKNAMMVMLALMIIITVDTRYVWRNYDLASTGEKKLFGIIRLPKKEDEKEFSKRDYLINFVSLTVLCIPVFLAEFPGFFVYDAQEELNEVLTRSFSTHHPLLHVLLLGGTIALFHKLSGSWNLGIAAYMILQMLVISAVYAYVVSFLQKKGIGKKARVFWLAFYGLFPTIVMYTLCSCKDGLFTAFLLIITVLLLQLFENPDEFLKDKKKVALFMVSAVLMPLFRHNGFYAYLVFIPFALIYFRKKLKPFLVTVLVAPVVLYLIVSNVLALACGTEGTHHQEMLTVPIMQLARVYSYEGDTLSKEDKEVIESYITKQGLDKYTPRVSDLVKVDFNNELYEKNSGDFWNAWFKVFKEHPIAYVNAWMLTSYGYYYPPAVINVYKGNTVYTFTYDESSYFGYEVEPPGERKSLIPAIDSLYKYISIGSFQKDATILHLFFSPGLYLFIYMFVFAYRLSKKRARGILPFLPMILTFCTVLLGPTYLIRYVLYLWTCLPLLMVSDGTETGAGAV
ncbi:hypothetical protein D6855_08505 [Butyrivibrio sp. CB08]|uniref:DUF6020 family protein n=1 Tax=Butyrivibrio sp. CB08 TaxID=2364879 RepID=UPI000EA83E4C|nr:DUF6020 family protein [Butyrivibrio sp. CB08]RKM59818.1 hypothetical protein D6855_08505 [Butyrivibrio sp. CB08]